MKNLQGSRRRLVVDDKTFDFLRAIATARTDDPNKLLKIAGIDVEILESLAITTNNPRILALLDVIRKSATKKKSRISLRSNSLIQRQFGQLVPQVETQIECWKEFNRFVNVARSKKFGTSDEYHFLDIKSSIVQDLELIYDALKTTSPTREEIYAFIVKAPSLRYLAEMSEGELLRLETQWHKIYVGWHSVLFQLKMKQRGKKAFDEIKLAL